MNDEATAIDIYCSWSFVAKELEASYEMPGMQESGKEKVIHLFWNSVNSTKQKTVLTTNLDILKLPSLLGFFEAVKINICMYVVNFSQSVQKRMPVRFTVGPV